MSEDNFPKILYHYTSAQGFLGILQSRTLWASHILFQNDLREGKIAFSVFDELLNNDFKDYASNKEFAEEYDLFKSCKESGVYTISFSEKKDDLSMWNGYSGENFSVCFGVDVYAFVESLQSEETCKESDNNKKSGPLYGKISIELKKCIYDRTEQRLVIKEFLDKFTKKDFF